MAKEQSTDTSPVQPMEENKFKAIQDILMGGEMRQIEQRFHKLQNRLEASQEALEKELASLKASLHEQQTKQEQTFNEKLEHLLEKLSEKVERNHTYAKEEVARLDFEKSNRKELGKMFLMIGEALAKDE